MGGRRNSQKRGRKIKKLRGINIVKLVNENNNKIAIINNYIRPGKKKKRREYLGMIVEKIKKEGLVFFFFL